MRPGRSAVLSVLFLLATALPASAQEDCATEASPCPWVVTVDAGGFVGEASWTFTQDEWHTLTVANLDEEAQTVSISGYGVSVTAPADGDASTDIQFTQAGTFTLTHQRTGKTATLRVVAGDSIDEETPPGTGAATGGTTTRGTPGAGLAAAGPALFVALAVRRRRAVPPA